MFINVDFPAPLGPNNPNIDFLGIFKSIPLRASKAFGFL